MCIRDRFIDGAFDEAYLRGHMRRIGLATASTPEATIRQLLPVVADDLIHEADRLRDLNLAQFGVLAPDAPAEANAAALQRFLDVAPAVAQDLARTPHLFTD